MYVLNLDCRHGLAMLPENSVDAIVCDPPYGLKFMGSRWDYDVPGTDVWEQCLRVLKPGGHLLSFAGSRTYHRIACNIEDAGFELRDQMMWIYGSGMNKVGYIKEAQAQWPGVGGTLKPAHEPIAVARKPFRGTLVANLQTHGVGGFQIDGCRVPSEKPTGWGGAGAGGNTWNDGNCGLGQDGEPRPVDGRWPANILHDGSSEVVALFPESAGAGASLPNVKITGYGDGIGNGESAYLGGPRRPFNAGTGSAARFFYCAKASRRDRDEGTQAGNPHVTVKPTELMRYLCRLVTPPGGLIVDPFAGSGSTGKGALLEGFQFVGFELEAHYCEVANARLAAVARPAVAA